jgi:hypothetical protein
MTLPNAGAPVREPLPSIVNLDSLLPAVVTQAERNALTLLENVHQPLTEITDAPQAKVALAAARAVEIYVRESGPGMGSFSLPSVSRPRPDDN